MVKYIYKIIIVISCFLLFQSGCKNVKNKLIKADEIIYNGMILTMNHEKKIIKNGVLVIKGSKIFDIGSEDLIKRYSGKKFNAEGGIIMPGMINAHTHAAMSVFRSLADDVENRLEKFIFPLEKKMVNAELVYKGTKLAAVEMLKGGVTTFVDMYLFEEAAASAIKEIGMRAILTQNIIKYPTADGSSSEALIERAINFVKKYKNDDLITPGFGPHAPHTVEKEALQKINKLSSKYDLPISMHVAETRDEFEYFKKEFNMTPVEYLNSIGILNDRFIAAHMIFVNESDIKLLQKKDVGISHNMIANIKSAKGVSPAIQMYKKGLRIGLGTDGPMSSNTLDIIRQMGYVSTIHKLVNSDRTVMPAVKVVEMATMGGARALHMEDQIGSLEKGKLADIVIVETQSINMMPIYDPYSVLVYSANASNVRTVFINGKIVVENKRIKNIKINTKWVKYIEDKVKSTLKN